MKSAKSDDPKRVVESGYDQAAHNYAALEYKTEWHRMRWLQKVLDRLRPGSSVLDLGCGSGDPADIEISKKHKISGVDISKVQIDLASKNVPSGEFLHADVGSVDFSAESFDAVVSFYTIEHLPRDEHAILLRRIHRWLKPERLLLISTEADDVNGISKWVKHNSFRRSHDRYWTRWISHNKGHSHIGDSIGVLFVQQSSVCSSERNCPATVSDAKGEDRCG